MPSKTLISCLLLFLMHLYIVGMKQTDIVKYENITYQDWHSSLYLDQIFAPMFKKGGTYESYNILLNHAKQNRYCPQTTMMFLQFGKTYLNTVFAYELLYKIFDHAIQSNAFWPTCYSPSKELFIALDVMQLDDCVVTIKQIQFHDDWHYCFLKQDLRYGDAVFELNIKLNKKCNDSEILSHVNKMKQLGS